MLLARDLFPGSTPDGGQILGNGVANTVSNVQAPGSFARRQVNTLAYWSPSMNGLRLMAHYSFGEDATPTARPRLLSTSAVYDGGPLSLGAAFETHGRYGGAGTQDRAWVLYGAYTFGDLKLGAYVVDMHYERLIGSDTLDLDVRNWQLQATYRLGKGLLKAAYTRADNGSGSLSALGTDTNGQVTVDASRMAGQATAGPDTGASQIALGYEYGLSKRTAWHTNLLFHRNERNGAYTPFAGVPSPTGALGVRTRLLSVGLRHVF
ncbi:Outer membrane porin protein 32 precursor [Methylibium sp. T29-B]|nr:Outer membrane porin protein 32 precursor [Methylibium sp. T29-B]